MQKSRVPEKGQFIVLKMVKMYMEKRRGPRP